MNEMINSVNIFIKFLISSNSKSFIILKDSSLLSFSSNNFISISSNLLLKLIILLFPYF